MSNRRKPQWCSIISHNRRHGDEHIPRALWGWAVVCLAWSRLNILASHSMDASSNVRSMPLWTTVDAWVEVPTHLRLTRGKQRKRALSTKCQSMSRDICDTVLQDDFSDQEDRQHQCSVCLQQFSSRNALFRHVRNGHTPKREGNPILKPLVKYTIAISLGYLRDGMSFSSSSISELAGQQIRLAIRYALQRLQYPIATNEAYAHNSTIVTYTQASVAKSRPKCLGQDCASAEDIIIVKIVVPKDVLVSSSRYMNTSRSRHVNAVPLSSTSSHTHARQSRKNFLLHHLENCIPKFISLSKGAVDPVESAITRSNGIVQLHGIRILDDDDVEQEDDGHSLVSIPITSESEVNASTTAVLYPSSYRKIHAEQSCTQHIYHGLIPVEWLPNSTDIIHWYHTSYHETARHLRAPIPSTIRTLKQILRSMESHEQGRSIALDRINRKDTTLETYSGSSSEHKAYTIEDPPAKSVSINAAAKGRYGALAYRIPRFWHNYADQSLRISPNYDPAYRVIDRARIVDFVWFNDTNAKGIPECNGAGKLYVVCSIMGDEFLKQQVRRMLGSAVSMINEWLPVHRFLDQSIDPATIIETPIIPPNLVYRAGSRFHWNEIDGQRLFCFNKDPSHENKNICIMTPHDPIHWMHTQLSLSFRLSSHDLNSWFINLQDVVCPRICEQIYNRFEKPRPVWHPSIMIQICTPPDAYTEVLNILRYIISDRLWPSTSVARSSVIAPSFHGNTTAIEVCTNLAEGGSFTVVNTRILREINRPMDQSHFPLPKANVLFPELTRAVFKLEEWIIESGTVSQHAIVGPNSATAPFIQQARRSPSTHCAVNCNAQFLPHVDSGRGLGQSTSMIVGLGDYVGGEIVVEQISYPIRYQPLEFDGWNLRHWTNPFAGPDRYSLVWFTPATSTISG
jgi:hypothetical protein